jgi:hypothetical protein
MSTEVKGSANAKKNQGHFHMHTILRCLPLLAVAVLAGCHSDRSRATAKDASGAEKYQHHRILIWAIDKQTHRIKGFTEKTIAPGHEVTLEPVEGYEVGVETGPIEKVTVTDFRREWQEDRIPFKISHSTGWSEATNDLVSPFLHYEYGIGEDLDSVVVGVPVGTIDSPSLLKLLKQKHTGTAAELEDLLFTAFDLPQNEYIGLYDLLQVYQLLGRTERRDRWLRLMEKGTPHEKIDAAAVLAILEDEQATNVFCDAVLDAKGNRQVGLIELLCEMPPSDKALETIVKLIISQIPYLTQAPEGVGVADKDRRYCLIRSLTEKYSKEKVRTYADELRRWAESDYGKTQGGMRILDFLADEEAEK